MQFKYVGAKLAGCFNCSIFTGLLFGFKFLLCQKLSENIKLDYSEVLSPVFILLQLIMIRACQLH